MRQTVAYPSLTVEELIEELAEVTVLLTQSYQQRCTAQQDFDKTFVNRYYQSHGKSVSERDREADYFAQTEKEDLTEFEHQVLVHSTISNFLVHLITWKYHELNRLVDAK